MNMKKAKKLLSIILTLGVILSLLPMTALAVIAPVSGTDWTLDSSGVLTITSDAGMSDWIEYDTWQETVTSIVIGDAVTSIPDSGFYYCYYVGSVTIGNGVTTIGKNAFQNTDVTDLTLGSKVQSIGESAFQDTDITSLSLPDSLTEIGAYAFDGCTSITSALAIPDSVTTIGESAFDYCTGIPSVTLPNNETSIGANAFDTCSGMISLTIPNAAISIGDNAFHDCSGITSLTIPASVTSIGYSAFSNCYRLTSLTISSATTSIGDNAFYYCNHLTSLTLPDGMTTIGNYVFSGIGNNLDLTIPDTVTDIGEGAFSECDLVSVTLPDSLKTIGVKAFYDSFYDPTSITIPASVTSIGDSAFDQCSLESVFFLGNTDTIGSDVFYTYSLNGIYVPEDDLVSYQTTLSDYTSYIFPIPAAITKAGATTYYPTLTEALAAAANGDTVTLVSNITELASYTVLDGTIITLDGQGKTVTGVCDAALELDGEGTIVLKNITLYGSGSTETYDSAYGLQVGSYSDETKVLNVLSSGTVNVDAESPESGGDIYGLLHYSAGTVNITSVNCTAVDSWVYGIDNEGTGTVNVSSVTANSSGSVVYGAYNGDIGTINVTTVTADQTNPGSEGVYNYGDGTINVNSTSGGYCGIDNYGTGTINVTTATGGIYGVYNRDAGVVNVVTATGDTAAIENPSGTVNTDTDVAQLTLSAGSGAICALNSITVAASGSTTIGTLPGVYRNGAYSSDWYTVSASLFSGTTVTGATTLYSSLYTPDPAIDTAAISGVTAPVNGGVPTSTIADTTEYTATITWSPTASTFAASTAYTATITIVPKTGYTLTGVAENFFTVAGAVATNAADSGVVTAVFPATAADTLISTPAIAGVTAPATGATPTSTIADTTEYTAMISWSPADAAFAASTAYTATIIIVPKTGYTLTGVAENFFTVAGAMATNDADSGVVTAVFPETASSGSTGGGGSSVPAGSNITVSTDDSMTTETASVTGSTSGGAQTVAVPGSIMTSLTDAAKTAETAGGKAVAIIDTGSRTGLNAVSVTIPGTQFGTFASGTSASLQITSGLAAVAFSSDAVDAIDAAGSGDVSFKIGTVDHSALSAGQQVSVGDRPVYGFSVAVGGTTVSQFGGIVTVTLPYTLQGGENPNAIVVYYVDASGNLQTMQGAYDDITGTVTFETTHFSYFVIGYNKVDFTDVADTAWCNDAVTFLAARGITTGTTATTFSPYATLTRGQFITLLLRAYDIEAVANPTNNFSDAGDTYYTGYLAAAKELGISNGVGDNKFAPQQVITRQAMFTMLYNALKVLDKLPQNASSKTLADFTDAGDVAPWANEAITALIKAGTVSGNGDKISPTDTATRAEMAQVLYNLMAK